LSDEGELKLIKREIAIHSQLDHPHIVKLWSAFFEQEKIFMILEYAENRSMQEYMAEKEGLAEAEAFKYFYQTVKAVEYLH
jgi:serine/threonine protein kinase